jgi:bifunctional DNA-binding transcriptional regulator/antitoxin component of YhaV-PrlF toxin-antitoxin module
VALQPPGRVTLPAAARQVLGAAGGGAKVRGLWWDVALVVRPAGPGRSMAVDGRGRLVVPVWLRQAVDPSASVLVGVRAAVAPIVVVAPTRVLDRLGEILAGEGR